MTKRILLWLMLSAGAYAQTSMGPIRTPQLNQGLYVGQSGYPSIQSAVTYGCSHGQQSFQVIIHPGINPPDTPAQVTGGCNGTYIEDARSVPTYYTWNGTHYVQTSNGGGGGGGGGVVVTTNLLAGDGGGATTDSGVQGKLGYLEGNVFYSTGYSGTPPFAVPPAGRAAWWWIPTSGPNGSAGVFGTGGGSANGGVQLWGANATGSNDQVYLDCQMLGCDFKVTPTFNGSPLAAPAPPLNYYQMMGSGNQFATKSLFYAPASGSVTPYNETSDPFFLFSHNATNTYAPQNAFHNTVNCSRDTVQFNGNEEHDCLFINDTWIQPGLSAGNAGNGNAGWTVNKTFYIKHDDLAMGIDQIFSLWHTANHIGDSSLFYGYLWNKGGYSAYSDEGATGLVINGGNTGEYFEGYSSSAGTGLTSITLYNYGDEPQSGAFLIDLRGDLLQGHAIGYSGNYITTAETHTATPVQGSTSTAITLPSGNHVPGGVSVTVPVNVSQGTFTMGSTIMFGCNEYFDQVTPTAVSAPSGGIQNITANFLYGHQAGCNVYQGGPFGTMDFNADRNTAPNNQSTMTSYLVVGAPTATTLDVRMYQSGGNQNIPPMRHNFGQSVNNVTLTRSGNNIQACGLPFTFSGQAVNVTGATDASFNGTAGASVFDNNGCAIWGNTGANGSTTGTVQTGGIVETAPMQGTGAFFVWPEAMILSAGSTMTNVAGGQQPQFNGTVNLAPNDMVVTSGDYLINPNYMANKTLMIEATGTIYTPPTASLQVWNEIAYGGPGATTANFMGQRINNGSAYTSYLGGGGSGLLQGPTAQRIMGPHYQTQLFDSPLANGVVTEVQPSPMCSTGNTAQCGYRARQLDAHNGNVGYAENYNPVTMGYSTYIWDDHGGHSQYFLDSANKTEQFLNVNEQIQNGGLFNVTNSNNQFVVPPSVYSPQGNANVPSPSLMNGNYVCSFANKACDGTTTTETNFNEAAAGNPLIGTTPAICINGCTGTWTGMSGWAGFNYASGGLAQASANGVSNAVIMNTGTANAVYILNVKQCNSSVGWTHCNIIYRHQDDNNYDQLVCYPPSVGGYCQNMDIVAGTGTFIGPQVNTSVTGLFMITMNGPNLTILMPNGTVTVTTANTTGTGVGFMLDGPGGVGMQVASYTVRSLSSIAGTGGGGSMTYPAAGIGVSTGTAWTTSIAPSSIALLTGAAFTGAISAPSGTINGSPICTTATGCGGTGGGMVYPAAGVPVSTGSAWTTPIDPTTLARTTGATFTGPVTGTTGTFSGGSFSGVTYQTIYTIASGPNQMPSASTVGAGASVMVSDASSYTPGTCTGGGTSWMIAISNGTSWSCH